MIDILTQASIEMNGPYLNGVDARRPKNVTYTETFLRQAKIGVEAAAVALYAVHGALERREGETGYGALVHQLARGREAMEEGPLSMRFIALLSLTAEDGDFMLGPREPSPQTIEQGMRVSDIARVIAACWHNLEMSRYTW